MSNQTSQGLLIISAGRPTTSGLEKYWISESSRNTHLFIDEELPNQVEAKRMLINSLKIPETYAEEPSQALRLIRNFERLMERPSDFGVAGKIYVANNQVRIRYNPNAKFCFCWLISSSSYRLPIYGCKLGGTVNKDLFLNSVFQPLPSPFPKSIFNSDSQEWIDFETVNDSYNYILNMDGLFNVTLGEFSL